MSKNNIIEKTYIPSAAGGDSDIEKSSDIKTSKRYFILQALLLFLVAFVLYANSIPNGFNMDDELYTVNAKAMADEGLSSMHQIFRTQTFVDAENSYEYRPITMLSFFLQYRYISSSPGASHLINVILYALTCVVLFILLCKWFGRKYSWFAFFVCLVFVVCPLHTEIVDSIKNRDELLVFLFSFMALLAVWRLYETNKLVYAVLFVFLFLLAALSKKTALAIVPLVPLAYYFFSNMPLRKLLRYSLVAAVPLIMIRIYMVFMPIAHRITFEHENPFYQMNGMSSARIATSVYIMGRYFYLHILPIHLAYYYGYKYVPLVGWNNIYVWISLLVYGVLIYFLVKNIRKKSVVVFGGLVYCFSVIVYSNLLKPAPGMMAERFMYLPSLGFSVMLCWAICKLFKTDLSLMTKNKWLVTLVALLCLCFAGRSFDRNRDWKDKYTLYGHDMKYLDSSAKANSMYAEILVTEARKYKELVKDPASKNDNRAVAYSDSAAQLLAEAKAHYRTALRISPGFPNALANTAIILLEEDSIALAKSYMKMALETTTQKALIYHRLSIIYRREGQYDSSLFFFNKSISADSSYLEAYCDLSKLLIEMNDTVKAEQVLLVAAVENKKSSIPYIQLADIALFKHDTSSIVFYCEKAAELKPGNIPILIFLSSYYKAKDDLAKSNYYKDKMGAISAQ